MYLLTMERCTGTDNFILGYFDTRAEAEFIGLAYEYYRGGKYKMGITETSGWWRLKSPINPREDHLEEWIDFYIKCCIF